MVLAIMAAWIGYGEVDSHGLFTQVTGDNSDDSVSYDDNGYMQAPLLVQYTERSESPDHSPDTSLDT